MGLPPSLWECFLTCCSVSALCPTPCDPVDCSTPGFPFPYHLPDFAQILLSIESVMPSNHLSLCCPLLFLPSIFPSIRVFSNELALHIMWPKYCSFSFSISLSRYSGLISFRIDWLDLLAVQGTLKSLLQHHSSKASSVIQCSAFFMVQLSYYRKTIALTILTLVGKVTSLLLNMLSRFDITFLPKSKLSECPLPIFTGLRHLNLFLQMLGKGSDVGEKINSRWWLSGESQGQPVMEECWEDFMPKVSTVGT